LLSFSQRFGSLSKRLSGSVQGSQIVELAIALPFMMVLIVGIFDFGQAFNTKQKINTAAREAARYAANQSTLDWSQGASAPSLITARDVVDAYLINGHLNDCGLSAAIPSYDPTTFKWTFTSTGTCPTSLVLVIERASTYTMTNGTNVIATKVTVTYPLQWHFSSVMKVLLPASNYPGPVFTITSNAVMANLS
jgi:Flp pilus assembly protein TadG